MTEQTCPQPDRNPTKASPNPQLLRQNLRAAKELQGQRLPPRLHYALQFMTQEWGFSLEAGEILIFGGSCYVIHTGLLRLAHRQH